MAVRLIPRDVKFFRMFSDMAENATAGARLLSEILSDGGEVMNRERNSGRGAARGSLGGGEPVSRQCQCRDCRPEPG